MYIGIDLGGTNIAAGLVDKDGRILCHESAKTLKERDYTEIVKDMASLCERVVYDSGLKMSDIESIGIGSPGTIDNARGVVVYSNNIKMHDAPVAAELRKYIPLPVSLENDANAAAYGEYIASGGKAKSFVLMTLGTGVGGGVIIDGKIYRGFNGAGAELGHSTIIMDGEQCTCGRKGCLEAYASATALIRQTEEMMRKHPGSSMHAWTEAVGHISGRTAFECAAAGDEAAIAVRDAYIKYLAEGVCNIVNIFQPELLAIGGGISREGDTLLDPLRELVYANDYNKYMKKTEIRAAKLLNDAGIVGAAMAAANKA